MVEHGLDEISLLGELFPLLPLLVGRNWTDHHGDEEDGEDQDLWTSGVKENLTLGALDLRKKSSF